MPTPILCTPDEMVNDMRADAPEQRPRLPTCPSSRPVAGSASKRGANACVARSAGRQPQAERAERVSDVATGLSWLCYYRALSMAPASWVAPIDKLSLVIVVILAVIFLAESLT